jgi:subtilisin-like proprotein convertase family protein
MGGRGPLLLVFAAAAAACLFADVTSADARKRVVKQMDVCIDVDRAIPDGGRMGDFLHIPLPTRPLANGAQVLDADVRIRLTHPALAELDILLVTPVGLMVPLTLGNGGTGHDLGANATDCRADFAIFDDQAPTPISGVTSAPFVGRFRPEGALGAAYGSWADGAWRFYLDDTVAGNQGVVEALGLGLTYRCIKGRKRCRGHPKRIRGAN